MGLHQHSSLLVNLKTLELDADILYTMWHGAIELPMANFGAYFDELVPPNQLGWLTAAANIELPMKVNL